MPLKSLRPARHVRCCPWVSPPKIGPKCSRQLKAPNGWNLLMQNSSRRWTTNATSLLTRARYPRMLLSCTSYGPFVSSLTRMACRRRTNLVSALMGPSSGRDILVDTMKMKFQLPWQRSHLLKLLLPSRRRWISSSERLTSSRRFQTRISSVETFSCTVRPGTAALGQTANPRSFTAFEATTAWFSLQRTLEYTSAHASRPQDERLCRV